jgi:phosphoribosylformylglycinamidine synthase
VPLQDTEREFSSSEYAKTIAGIVAGEPPTIDLAAEKRLIDCLAALADAGTLQSAHDVSEGGLAVTLAESCFAAAGLGASVAVPEDVSAEYALFGERGTRAVVTATPAKIGAVQATARQYGVGGREIGKVTRDNSLRIEYNGRAVVSGTIDTLRAIWADSLQKTLKV